MADVERVLAEMPSLDHQDEVKLTKIDVCVTASSARLTP